MPPILFAVSSGLLKTGSTTQDNVGVDVLQLDVGTCMKAINRRGGFSDFQKCWSNRENYLMSLEPSVAIGLPSYLLDLLGNQELACCVKQLLYMSKFCCTWQWYFECLMSIWKVLWIALSWYGVLTCLGFVMPWTWMFRSWSAMFFVKTQNSPEKS